MPAKVSQWQKHTNFQLASAFVFDVAYKPNLSETFLKGVLRLCGISSDYYIWNASLSYPYFEVEMTVSKDVWLLCPLQITAKLKNIYQEAYLIMSITCSDSADQICIIFIFLWIQYCDSYLLYKSLRRVWNTQYQELLWRNRSCVFCMSLALNTDHNKPQMCSLQKFLKLYNLWSLCPVISKCMLEQPVFSRFSQPRKRSTKLHLSIPSSERTSKGSWWGSFLFLFLKGQNRFSTSLNELLQHN